MIDRSIATRHSVSALFCGKTLLLNKMLMGESALFVYSDYSLRYNFFFYLFLVLVFDGLPAQGTGSFFLQDPGVKTIDMKEVEASSESDLRMMQFCMVSSKWV